MWSGPTPEASDPQQLQQAAMERAWRALPEFPQGLDGKGPGLASEGEIEEVCVFGPNPNPNPNSN